MSKQFIRANVRTPDERWGDLSAQIAANRRASQRISDLAGKYGAKRLTGIMQEVLDYSERMMRTLLGDLPDGEGEFEDFCDGDGIVDEGESEDSDVHHSHENPEAGKSAIKVDFAGTDPAVAGPMNAPLSVTASGVYCSLKMIVDPDGLIPANWEYGDQFEVVAPKGSVVNATFPSRCLCQPRNVSTASQT